MELHHPAALSGPDAADAAYASVRERLERATLGAPVTEDAHGRARLVTTPPLNRASMAPGAWPPVAFRRRAPDEGPDSPDPRGRWHGAATLRRAVLLALVLAQTAVATWAMTAVLPYHGRHGLEIAILGLFAVLFCWVSAGFWTAMMGFIVLLARGDRYAISRTAHPDAPIDPETRTAVVMPIANENVERVFAGMRATYRSLEKTGLLGRFDFFVLSDSSDADIRVAEIAAWTEACRELGAFGRLFYRWRQHRIKRKSGNVADFCRRWGRNYRYMVVLDADSVMTGDCLTRLVRLMEANPNAGIVQTAPRAAGRDTLYARVQQFATRVYGPLFTAGLHFWQLGESHYWGHNAIIRVAPFIRHCALGRLPGSGSLSGEILSHDFVEAALMRRAGWAVWIVYDLPGSYEEMPPNLIDELKRDRRWCQGNLINSRLFLASGLHPAHRAVFMTGVMAYLSAPLWFLFLVLSTVLLAVHVLVPPTYFTRPGQLFPLWPEWHLAWAVGLCSATAVLLFLPKMLSVVLLIARERRGFGGAARLAAGMAAELVFSALLAPVRMLFHTRFVLGALTGWSVQWKSPSREDAETTWGEALRRHGLHTLLGLAWAALVYGLDPSFLWWLLPVVGALLLSIPVSVYTSRVSLGKAARRAGLFVIPEELDPPEELRAAHAARPGAAPLPGFAEAVADPVVNALVCASGVARLQQPEAARRERDRLVEHARRHGPAALPPRQKLMLLNDPIALSRLHLEAGKVVPLRPADKALRADLR
jgi:membrane glycosyltransferase